MIDLYAQFDDQELLKKITDDIEKEKQDTETYYNSSMR